MVGSGRCSRKDSLVSYPDCLQIRSSSSSSDGSGKTSSSSSTYHGDCPPPRIVTAHLGPKPWLCCNFSYMPIPPSSSSSSSSFSSLSRAMARKLMSGPGLLLGRLMCLSRNRHSYAPSSHHHMARKPTSLVPNSATCSNWYGELDSSSGGGSRMSFSSSSSSYDPEAIAECLEFIRKCALGKKDDERDTKCTHETRKERINNGHLITKSPLCHSPLDIP